MKKLMTFIVTTLAVVTLNACSSGGTTSSSSEKAATSSSSKAVEVTSERDTLIAQFKKGDFSAINGSWRIATLDAKGNQEVSYSFDQQISINEAQLGWSMPGYASYMKVANPSSASSILAPYGGKDPSSSNNVSGGAAIASGLTYSGIKNGLITLTYKLDESGSTRPVSLYVIPEGEEIPNLVYDVDKDNNPGPVYTKGTIASDTSKMRLITFYGFMGGLGGAIGPGPHTALPALIGGMNYNSVYYRTSETAAPDPKLWGPQPQSGKMDASQIAKGDYSSIYGTWSQIDSGSRVVFAPGNLVQGEKNFLALKTQGDGYAVMKLVTSGTTTTDWIFVQAGKSLPSQYFAGGKDGSDSSKDRVLTAVDGVVSQDASNQGMYYYNARTTLR